MLPKHLGCFPLSDAMLYFCFSLLHNMFQTSRFNTRGFLWFYCSLFFHSIIFSYMVTHPLAHAAIHISVLLILLQVTPRCVSVTIFAWTVLYISVTNSEHVHTTSIALIWHTNIYVINTNQNHNWPKTKDYMQKMRQYMTAYSNLHQNIPNTIKKVN